MNYPIQAKRPDLTVVNKKIYNILYSAVMKETEI